MGEDEFDEIKKDFVTAHRSASAHRCEVKCDGITLYWENGIKMKDLDGKIKPAPLDIDPNVVYQLTVEPEYIE